MLLPARPPDSTRRRLMPLWSSPPSMSQAPWTTRPSATSSLTVKRKSKLLLRRSIKLFHPPVSCPYCAICIVLCKSVLHYKTQVFRHSLLLSLFQRSPCLIWRKQGWCQRVNCVLIAECKSGQECVTLS